ncbi:MAG: methyltransferase FkbM family [Devosia sp.]|nr:methyltransferase FkbM family [Devosia sp.]
MHEVLTHFEPSPPSKLRTAWDKLRWGMRAVGPGRVLQGAARLALLRVRRPKRSEVKLRSGTVMEFDYPSQFPPMLVMFGDLVDPEFAFLRAIARPGWTVVDVGAAIGQFTLFAASLGAKVHAFEPSGANVATLGRNLERNGVAGRVRVHQVALSNTTGEARFQTDARTWLSRLDRSDGGELVPVQRLSDTLGELSLPHVSVLKINVSGYEPAVMEGAWRFLEEGGADILVLLLGLESLPWYEKIAGLGYRFFYYHPPRKTLHEVTAFDASSVLDHRPWPARHIIAVRSGAIDEGVVSGLNIRPLQNGSSYAQR